MLQLSQSSKPSSSSESLQNSIAACTLWLPTVLILVIHMSQPGVTAPALLNQRGRHFALTTNVWSDFRKLDTVLKNAVARNVHGVQEHHWKTG